MRAVNTRIDSSTALPLRRSSRGLQSRVQAVENRAADAELCVAAAELYLLCGIEFCEGVHQSYHARRNQVFDIDVLRQPLVVRRARNRTTGRCSRRIRSCSGVIAESLPDGG